MQANWEEAIYWLYQEDDKIYSSPLIRTLQTAKEIMKVSNAEVIIDNRIREIDWGEYDVIRCFYSLSVSSKSLFFL